LQEATCNAEVRGGFIGNHFKIQTWTKGHCHLLLANVVLFQWRLPLGPDPGVSRVLPTAFTAFAFPSAFIHQVECPTMRYSTVFRLKSCSSPKSFGQAKEEPPDFLFCKH
jgi:hypothetical protein